MFKPDKFNESGVTIVLTERIFEHQINYNLEGTNTKMEIKGY